MNIKQLLFLIGIIILGASLRLYQPCYWDLPSCFIENSQSAKIVPPSLNWDEVSLGYNAYSILKTGKDEWGKSLPLSFEAFGDYKLPGYIYTDVPFVALFGLNFLTVRLPSMLAGILSLYLIFLIGKKLFNSTEVGLIASFLLAISPWHLFLSRVALEANLAFMFFLAGLYLFLQALHKPKFAFPSIVLFGLTIFTYNSARVFVPLFLVVLIALYRRQIMENKKAFIGPGLLLMAVFLIGAYYALFQDSSSRYFWVAIVDQGAINYLDQARVTSHLSPLLTELLYNRYSYFLERAFFNYFSHFSPQFLFLQGGSNYQFSLPGFGLLYLIDAPFLIWGLFGLRNNRKAAFAILGWLLLSPVPSAITREAPHALRAIFMLGSIQIISALGIYKALLLIKKQELRNSMLTLLVVAFLISLTNYYQSYLSTYPKKYSQSWQYGYKELYDDLSKMNVFQGGRSVYISKVYGEPHIFYLFYTKYDPATYQSNPTLIRYSRSNWRWVDRLDNIYFVNDWEVKDKLKNVKNSLLVTSPGNYPSNFTKVESIQFLDGKDAFDIAESR